MVARIGEIRGIGDLGASNDSDQEKLCKLVAQCDLTRAFHVHQRKSNAVGHKANDNYLLAQEELPAKLLSAGVPKSIMTVVPEPAGTSGALARQFRRVLNDLWDRMGTGVVGTVSNIDVARLFRDDTQREPTLFASRMGKHRVSVLTKDEDGEWALLQMWIANDRDKFLRLANQAAKERKGIRSRMMTTREQSVSDGNYSGKPMPIGWAVKPGVSTHASDDGKAHPPREYVYEPHREYKLQVWRESLLPHIKSYPALHRHLAAKGMYLEPFTLEVAKETFSRSCLCKVWWKEAGEDGKIIRRYLRRDERMIPTVSMLPNLLEEPLALGYRLYGSGRSGYYKVEKAKRMADASDRTPDTLMRPGKSVVGNDPNLAICRTEDEKALYWRVVEKWSRIDIRAALEAGVIHGDPTKQPKNALRSAAASRPGKPRGAQMTNHWAGKGFCGHHGMTDEFEPHRLRPMRLTANNGVWVCAKDNADGNSEHTCAVWGCDNRLGKILDFHLFTTIHHWVSTQHNFLDDIKRERDHAKQQVVLLEQEIKELVLDKEAQEAIHNSKERRLRRPDSVTGEMLDEDSIQNEMDANFALHVRPLTQELVTKKKQLAQAKAAGLATPTEHTEAELRATLQAAVDCDNLPVNKKRELVELFVDYFIVFVGDGKDVRETIVLFQWAGITDATGQPARDILVSWRGWDKDTRVWTQQEDDAICSLWPAASGATYDDIKARLQHGRKFSAIRRRAIKLGVLDGSRSKAWQQAAQETEKSWGDQNPDVLYLNVHANLRTLMKRSQPWGLDGEPYLLGDDGCPVECDEMVVGKGRRDTITLPEHVHGGVKLLLCEGTSRSLLCKQNLSSIEEVSHPCLSSLLPFPPVLEPSEASSPTQSEWADPGLPLVLRHVQAFLAPRRSQ